MRPRNTVADEHYYDTPNKFREAHLGGTGRSFYNPRNTPGAQPYSRSNGPNTYTPYEEAKQNLAARQSINPDIDGSPILRKVENKRIVFDQTYYENKCQEIRKKQVELERSIERVTEDRNQYLNELTKLKFIFPNVYKEDKFYIKKDKNRKFRFEAWHVLLVSVFFLIVGAFLARPEKTGSEALQTKLSQ
eukprot:TRINITY_DN1075_c0_g1_i7.p2 TRINITY_DN1075_c0_g1~~TRINITY_DN1075_c0_g1_i7.p2  ORF type:complete len:190 (-),score=12.96 TRINITY_DN1075_c0_g1_i7:251-820(-)